MTEIRRLQTDGVPAAPTFIEDHSEPPLPSPPTIAIRLASQSPQVIDAVEDAEIEEAAVRKEEATVQANGEYGPQAPPSVGRTGRLRSRVDAQVANRQAAALQVEEDRLHAAWVERVRPIYAWRARG